MEIKYAVNVYERKNFLSYQKDTRRFYTLNMAFGTTPFMIFENNIEYFSNMYKIQFNDVQISFFWYRPTKLEFDSLEQSMQDYVLNGALLRAKPSEAITVADDPIDLDTSFSNIQKYFKALYGRTL